MLALAFAYLVAVTSTLASPVDVRRRALNVERVPQFAPGSSCDGLGGGAFDTAYNFSLAAYNSSFDLVGVPLVLGQNGAIAGAEFKVFSTFASYPYNDFPTISMTKGGLRPDGEVSGAAGEVADGTEPSFIITNLDPPAPAQVYCGLASTSAHGGGTGNPELAVNHNADGFALCRTGDQPTSQVNVVYKPTSDNFGTYIYESCYPVKLLMIGLID